MKFVGATAYQLGNKSPKVAAKTSRQVHLQTDLPPREFQIGDTTDLESASR
ncbi:hypothetical protein [Nostoc sp.]|uniref:hypothetical protein n=1 Tax=Nostoc sp. TaxID=1180 RepID=UPI002FF89BA5